MGTPTTLLHSTRRIIGRLSVALAFVTTFFFSMPSVLAACDDLHGLAKVTSAVVTIVPSPKGMTISITGDAVVSASQGIETFRNVHDISPYSLCVATVGELKLNDADICNAFSRPEFTGRDSIKLENASLKFSITTVAGHTGRILIAGAGDRTLCPAKMSLRILAGPNGKIEIVDPLPDTLTSTAAIFDVRTWPANRDFPIYVRIRESTENAVDVMQSPPSMLPSSKWGGRLLGRLVGSIVFVSTLILIFQLGIPHLFKTQGNSAATQDFLVPIRTVLVILFAGTITEAAYWLAQELDKGAFYAYPDNLPWEGYGHVREQLSAIATPYGFDLVRFAGVASFLAIAIALFISLSFFLKLAARRTPTPRREASVEIASVLVIGTGLALLMVAIATAVLFVEITYPIGYELPAAVVSALLARIALGSLRKRFSLQPILVLGLALLAAVTVLFPTSPVVHLSLSVPSVASNTFVWFWYLFGIVADVLFMGTLLLMAVSLVRSESETQQRSVDRALLVLFVLAIVGIRNIEPAVIPAVFGTWLAADWLLFSGTHPDAERKRRHHEEPLKKGAANLGHTPDSQLHQSPLAKALVGGALTAAMFWLPYELRASANTGLATLQTSHVLFGSFTSGALGTLLLGHAFNRLRGNSGVAKAALLGLTAVVVNVASEFTTVAATRNALPAITEYISLVAALLLVAVFAYDLPNIRRQLAGIPPGDIAKGTGLANAIPILSGLGGALLTTLSPILFSTVGDALRDVVKSLLALPSFPSTH